MLYFCSGDMAEWSIAAVLKTVKPKGFGGSNPSVSAKGGNGRLLLVRPSLTAKKSGEMPEWSIGAVSKTVERFAFQGFESLSLRKKKQAPEDQMLASFFG